MATSICCAPNDRALSRLPIYDGLVSADGSFDQSSLAVTGDGLSFRPAVRVDRRDMTILDWRDRCPAFPRRWRAAE